MADEDQTPPVEAAPAPQETAPPPTWKEVEEHPDYQTAPPEKKLVAFDRWHNDVYNYASKQSDWGDIQGKFNQQMADRANKLSQDAGGVTPDQARVKMAVQAIQGFNPEPLPPVPGEPPATELPPAPTVPDLSLEAGAGAKTNAQAIREALQPLSPDVKKAFYSAQMAQAQQDYDRRSLIKGPEEQQITAAPTYGSMLGKGDIAGFGSKAYEDFRHEFAPFFGETEKYQGKNMIPWGKNADGSTRYEYHPLGKTADDVGLVPVIQKVLFANPMDVALAAGAKPTDFFYEHKPTDSAAESVAKGTFNAAQGLLQTFLSPAVWLGLGGSEAGARAISGGFSYQMLSEVKPKLEEAFHADTPGQVIENLLGVGTSLALGGKALQHAAFPKPAVIQPKIPELSDTLLRLAGADKDFQKEFPDLHQTVMDELGKRGLEPMDLAAQQKAAETARVAPETAKAVAETVPIVEPKPSEAPKKETPPITQEELAAKVNVPPESIAKPEETAPATEPAAPKKETPPPAKIEKVEPNKSDAITKLVQDSVEQGHASTAQEVQKVAGDNTTTSATTKLIKSALKTAYPPETLTGGAEEGPIERAGVAKIQLRTVKEPTGETDVNGNPITRIRPMFTNDVDATAGQLNKGDTVLIPKDFDPDKINPHFTLKRTEDGNLQVTAVDHPTYGEIREPGDLTTAYKESPEREKASLEQTGGKERVLTQLKPEYAEKIPGGATPTDAEAKTIQDFMKKNGFLAADEINKVGGDQIRNARELNILRFMRENPDKDLYGKGGLKRGVLKAIADRYAEITPKTQELLEKDTSGGREERQLAPTEESAAFEDVLKDQDPDLKPEDIIGPEPDELQEGDVARRSTKPTASTLEMAKQQAKTNLDLLDAMGIKEKNTPDAFGKALRYIASDPRETVGRKTLAKLILASGIDTSKVKFIRKFRPYAEGSKNNYGAMYRPNENDLDASTIFFNTADAHTQDGSVSGTILHEAVHHLTLAKIHPDYDRNPVEQKAYDNLNRAFEAAKKALKGVKGADGQTLYGIDNLAEFVTQTAVNTEFRTHLAELPPLEPKKSFLESVKQWIKNLRYGKEVKPGSLLDTADESVNHLLESPAESAKLPAREISEAAAKAIPPEEEPFQRGGWAAGISQRMYDRRDIPVLPGEITKAKEQTEQGIKDLEAGVDPEARMEEIKSIEAGATGKDFGLFRAQSIKLGKIVSDLEDKVAKDPSQANKDALQAAYKAELAWANKVKTFSTKAGEALAAHMGANNVDTGNYYDIRGKFIRDIGRTPTEKESAEIQKGVDETQKARTETAAADAKVAEEIQKAASPEAAEAAKVETAKAEKRAAAQGVKLEAAKPPAALQEAFDFFDNALSTDPRKERDRAQALEQAGLRLNKYFTDKFANKPPKIAGTNFTPQEAAAGWAWIRAHIPTDRPIKASAFYDKMATELGMSPALVRELTATNKTVGKYVDATYRAQSAQRAVQVANRSWMENVKKGLGGELADFAWNLRRSISVLSHVNAPLTHGLGLLAYPPTWTIQASNILKTFKVFGNTGQHEAMLQDIMDAKNYGRFTKAGLAVKIGTLDDMAQYQSLFERIPYVGGLARAGNRGMDVLKAMRMDIANKWYETRLTDADRAEVESDSKAGQQILQELMGLVNTSTGTTAKGTALGALIGESKSPFWRNALFAPRLEAARIQDVLIDPARAAQLFVKGAFKDLTSAERIFRNTIVQKNAWRVAVYMGALALNQSINNFTTKDQINILDPSKSDWLSFKVNGHTVILPSSFLTPLRMFLSVTASNFIPAEDRSTPLDKLARYGLGKTNPLIGDLYELTQGKQNYTGQPLPWGKRTTPRDGGKPKSPMGWWQYALSKAPIPVAQAAQEHYDAMRKYGVGPLAAKVIIAEGIGAVASMGAVHLHETPPEKPGKRVTLKDWKHPLKKRHSGGL